MMKQLLHDQSGATAVEYGLIAALIGVGAIAALMALGTEVSNTFSTADMTLADAATVAGSDSGPESTEDSAPEEQPIRVRDRGIPRPSR